jgi:hypothetical protein
VILAFIVVSIKGAASSALESLVRAAATALAVYVGCVVVGSVFEGGRIQTVTGYERRASSASGVVLGNRVLNRENG